MNAILPRWLYVAVSLGMTGCASDSRLSLGVSDPCESLQSIIADFDNGFASYRGARNDFDSFTLFRAREELVKGHCEVWLWAGGDSAYVCSANTPVEEVAEQRYQNSLAFVEECVGSDWQKETVTRERDGNYLGLATRFTSASKPGLVISVQNITPPGSYRNLRSNYLYIGTAGRSPKPE
ncbi:hypothetical protein QQF73_10935 [Marinobacter sp. M216]|uniref:DUF3558 domain-containing protein n=1 Tax=Marinobacter albus TaxID=3030833 RepID=A0ABT7HCN6_9GAMM|nr:hypothetical protein [Marinobacter sp. M216]MDK9558136.1 hypothetical protein [Marinobacter sp. M216]